MSDKSRRMGLPVVHEFAVGIDIGSRFHVVAVPPELTSEAVQTFQVYTSDLHQMPTACSQEPASQGC